MDVKRIAIRAVGCPLAVAWLLLGMFGAQAGGCIIDGPPPRLDSQPVEWTFTIASGQSCTRGLRSGAMTLDSVSIVLPAKVGEVTAQGYSFSYKAPRDFKGEDSFSVTMIGTNRRIRGSSTIQVHVSVR